MTHGVRGVAALALSGALALAACGNGPRAAGAANAPLTLVASFYPLQWMAQQIAGDRATVRSLTKPGAEPHDLELTPRDVAQVGDADLVVFLKGFQPAVDQAVDQEARGHAYDAAKAAHLDLRYTPIEGGQRSASTVDPHFWLDPIRLARVGEGFALRLGKVDPANADRYRANAAALTATLERLDREFATGLANCANKDLITSHNAFGYLARRYGMKQVGITGLTPEDEPSPADLAAVATFVRKHGVRTIYYETLVSPAIARTVARETGATSEVLDPIEGLTKSSAGRNYPEVMRSNLANIRKGQPCR